MLLRAALTFALLAARAAAASVPPNGKLLFAGGGVVVRTEATLLQALDNAGVAAAAAADDAAAAAAATVRVAGTVRLSSPLHLVSPRHDGVTIAAAHRGAGLRFSPGPVLRVTASGVAIRDLVVALEPTGAGAQDAALVAVGADRLSVVGATVEGGVMLAGGRGHEIAWSNVSNPGGANNGTCVHVASCGNATTLEACDTVIHDNHIHDCRIPPSGSPYDFAAQGVLLGGATGSPQCTVGVVVRHNLVQGVDQMGIRINNDNYAPCVNNQVVFNKVVDWGQSPKGDHTDCGCLYVYGHWFSPGNNLSFNYCHATNKSWGQNGVYLDDVASGSTIVGNVFQGGGSAIKLNGGAFNVIDSSVAVDQGEIGFGNCRGLRGLPGSWYTCENPQSGARWLKILQGVDYLGPVWAEQFPWYKGWCTNMTAGNGTSCKPAGAPEDYECAVLSRGNAVSRAAGVNVRGNKSFAFQAASGFPVGTGVCPEFVVSGGFNNVDLPPSPFFGPGEFVDYARGDLTLRDDSAVYREMPGFARVPFRSIGIGGGGGGKGSGSSSSPHRHRPTPGWRSAQLSRLPAWIWDRISTWCFPTFAKLPLTQSQIAWYSRFDMVDQCCSGLETDASGEWVPQTVETSLNISRALKTFKPATFFSPYIGMELGQNWYAAQAEWNRDEPHASQWLRFKNGTAMTCDTSNPATHGICALTQSGDPGPDVHVYDWRAAGMTDYFVHNITGPYLASSFVDGVFFDDIYTICEYVSGSGPPGGWFDASDAADFCSAAFGALTATADAFASAGKLPIFSVKGDETSATAYNISRYAEVLVDHGGMAYFEYWNAWPGQPRQEAMVLLASSLGSRGVPMQMHAAVGPCGNSTTFALATFLLAAAEHSYFSFGAGWNPGFEQSMWLPEFDMPLGPPEGPMTPVAPHVWEREFEHVRVRVNFTDCNATSILYK